jgi:hypothetical protein
MDRKRLALDTKESRESTPYEREKWPVHALAPYIGASVVAARAMAEATNRTEPYLPALEHVDVAVTKAAS